jgi:hypothetical protein
MWVGLLVATLTVACLGDTLFPRQGQSTEKSVPRTNP